MGPTKKISCEADNCPFGGELPYDRRTMTLGQWAEKVVLAACGLLVSILIGQTAFVGVGVRW